MSRYDGDYAEEEFPNQALTMTRLCAANTATYIKDRNGTCLSIGEEPAMSEMINEIGTSVPPAAVPEFRVWWIPQIPGKPFRLDVPSLDAGIMLCDALARYDLFQFENRIKPDYANEGGIEWRHPVLTEGDWYDVEPDDEEDVAEVRRLIAASAVSL